MYYVIINIINIYTLHCWNVLFGDICFNEGKNTSNVTVFPIALLEILG